MKRIVTPLMLLAILFSFAACNEKEFETQNNPQSEMRKQGTEIRMLIYRFGTGVWQEWECTSETLRGSLEELVRLSASERTSVSVYDKFGDPSSNPPAYMPDKIETTDIDKFVDFTVHWIERGYEVVWNYDPDTKTYTGEAHPQKL